MAHWSEDSKRLKLITTSVDKLSQIENIPCKAPASYLFWMPSGRSSTDATDSKESLAKVAQYCMKLNKLSTVCVLTTPTDAASMLASLGDELKFQHWIAIKTTKNAYKRTSGSLPNRHAALLVLTRYDKYLRHTKTRVQYTYCPTCGKTTKDYGGKKHMYHQYGTLISDVWRDIECDPRADIQLVVDRVRDLFGLDPYKRLYLIDLRTCRELRPRRRPRNAKRTPRAHEPAGNGTPAVSRLINDDCLKILPSLADDSVDFCFADLPYNLNKKYYKSNDSLDSDKYFSWCIQWLSELHRVLKPGRTLAVLNIPQWSVRYYLHLSSLMKFQAWIAWEALSFPVRRIMPAHYSIVCFSKGDPGPLPGLATDDSSPAGDELKTLADLYCVRKSCVRRRNALGVPDSTGISDLWHDVHRLTHNSRRVNHPCQLPPLLMRRLFALFTTPGDMILDCFNGAGTSTLVAQEMGRQFIGIELSSRYHNIAMGRHEMLSRGEDPFEKMDTVPTAKNSRVERLPRKKYKITKKALQLDVKRIAGALNRLPTREEVRILSKFPIKYFNEYFVSWGEVCAAARTTGMSETLPQGMR